MATVYNNNSYCFRKINLEKDGQNQIQDYT